MKGRRYSRKETQSATKFRPRSATHDGSTFLYKTTVLFFSFGLAVCLYKLEAGPSILSRLLRVVCQQETWANAGAARVSYPLATHEFKSGGHNPRSEQVAAYRCVFRNGPFKLLTREIHIYVIKGREDAIAR